MVQENYKTITQQDSKQQAGEKKYLRFNILLWSSQILRSRT